ncbi:hypothetical protein IL306_005618, partial [Fusarium sp. DS 682]
LALFFCLPLSAYKIKSHINNTRVEDESSISLTFQPQTNGRPTAATMDEPAESTDSPNMQPAQPDWNLLIEGASRIDHKKNGGVIKSGFHWDPSPPIEPSGNGFILCAREAYAADCAANFRIDDMWLAMLAYMRHWIDIAPISKNHDIPIPIIRPEELDTQQGVVDLMNRLVRQRFDAKVAETLMPNFRFTTTVADFASAVLILVGEPCKTYQQIMPRPENYPEYKDVTLVGHSDDWKTLVKKLEIIGEWSNYLRPATQWFITMANRVVYLWNHSDPTRELTCNFWKAMIKIKPAEPLTMKPEEVRTMNFDELCDLNREQQVAIGWLFNFYEWGKIQIAHELDDLRDGRPPTAIGSLLVQVKEGEELRNYTLVGGLPGFSWGSPGEVDPWRESGQNAIQPLSGWMLYVNKEPESSEPADLAREV